jgi:hypothetical protein
VYGDDGLGHPRGNDGGDPDCIESVVPDCCSLRSVVEWIPPLAWCASVK